MKRSSDIDFILAFTFLFVLSILWGCQSDQPPVAKPTKDSSQFGKLSDAQDKTEKALMEAESKRLALEEATVTFNSKLAANIDLARAGNQGNPEGFPKIIVEGELNIARSQLDGVASDPEEMARGERRRADLETGRAEEARRAYSVAAEDAKKMQSEIVRLKVERDVAQAEANAARALEKEAQKVFEAQLEKNRQENQKAIDKLVADHRKELDKEKRAFQRQLGWVLMGLGTVFIIGGAFLAYTGVQSGDPLKAIVRAAVVAGAGAFCFSVAWSINQWWFKWVFIGGCATGVAACLVYAWAAWKESQEKKALLQRSKEADEAEKALKAIGKVIDPLPEKSEIKQALSSKMSKVDKALIHELKAEDQRAEANLAQ